MNKYKIKLQNKIIDFNPNISLSDKLICMLQEPYPFQCLKNENLPNEKWEVYSKKHWKDVIPDKICSKYSYIKQIEVSNLGRVRIKGDKTSSEKTVIIPQENDPNYQDGYLRLKGYALLGHVYRMVARTFIIGNDKEPEDKKGKKYPIHHIDNNGYNNKIENLMYVSPEEHAKIHFFNKM